MGDPKGIGIVKATGGGWDLIDLDDGGEILLHRETMGDALCWRSILYGKGRNKGGIPETKPWGWGDDTPHKEYEDDE